jgi:hypothetical protein
MKALTHAREQEIQCMKVAKLLLYDFSFQILHA